MSEQEFNAAALKKAQEHQKEVLAGFIPRNSESDLIQRMWYRLDWLEDEVAHLRSMVGDNR